MSQVDLSKLRSSSLFPGLQNVGTASTLITLTGIVPAQGNLLATSAITFPDECIAIIRVNLPDAHGDLASSWFPIIGTVQLYDATSKWYLTIYTQPNPNGRGVFIDFTSNDAVTNTTLTDFRISLFAHLYTYPF